LCTVRGASIPCDYRYIPADSRQEDFADTLQIAGDEDEAHMLLQRYLERAFGPNTDAVVLNSNNSADRLEAVVPQRPGLDRQPDP
jgi:hypothetical protein